MPRCATASPCATCSRTARACPRPASPGGSRPGIRPGRSAGTRTPATCRPRRLLEAASGHVLRRLPREAVLAPLGMDASLGLPEADAPRTARVWQPGRYGEGELFNSRALPRATRRRRAAASRARAPTARSSPACSRAATPAARALLAARDGRGDARAAVRAAAGRRRRRGRVAGPLLGPRLRRARAARAALVGPGAERAGGQSLRRLGHARLARPRARARPRRARQPRHATPAGGASRGPSSALR